MKLICQYLEDCGTFTRATFYAKEGLGRTRSVTTLDPLVLMVERNSVKAGDEFEVTLATLKEGD